MGEPMTLATATMSSLFGVNIFTVQLQHGLFLAIQEHLTVALAGLFLLRKL